MSFAIPGMMPNSQPAREQKLPVERDGSAEIYITAVLREKPPTLIRISVRNMRGTQRYFDANRTHVFVKAHPTNPALDIFYAKLPVGTFLDTPCYVVVEVDNVVTRYISYVSDSSVAGVEQLTDPS